MCVYCTIALSMSCRSLGHNSRSNQVRDPCVIFYLLARAFPAKKEAFSLLVCALSLPSDVSHVLLFSRVSSVSESGVRYTYFLPVIVKLWSLYIKKLLKKVQPGKSNIHNVADIPHIFAIITLGYFFNKIFIM